MSSWRNRKSRPSLGGEAGGFGRAVGRVDALSIFPSTSLFYPISGGLSSALRHHGDLVVCVTSLGGALGLGSGALPSIWDGQAAGHVPPAHLTEGGTYGWGCEVDDN